MHASDQMHVPAALSQGKEPPVPIGQVTGLDSRIDLNALKMEKNLFHLQGIKHQILDHQASRIVITLTGQSHLKSSKMTLNP
jgi:hypothetical protein